MIMTTKEFTEKLDKKIEELGSDIYGIIMYLTHYKFELEEQIMDTHNDSKILVDEYEKKLWVELDEKTIGLDKNDEDDYDTIHQLGLEVGLNVESMKGNEEVRLAELNKTRDEKIAVLCGILEYYDNL